jgi:hypothetical protein
MDGAQRILEVKELEEAEENEHQHQDKKAGKEFSFINKPYDQEISGEIKQAHPEKALQQVKINRDRLRLLGPSSAGGIILKRRLEQVRQQEEQYPEGGMQGHYHPFILIPGLFHYTQQT